MSVNFSIGHIVRTFPNASGEFNVGQIIDYSDEKLIVEDYVLANLIPVSPHEVWSRFKVEMFMMNGKNGLYQLGDDVTVASYSGKWEVYKFGQNPRSTEAEWCALLLHEDGKRRLFWPAHLLMKV